MELGNATEAIAELNNIPAELQKEPEVLKVQWSIYAARKQWHAALDLADTLIKLDPDDALGWVHRSYALHELKRTQEARDQLLPVVDKFPISATIRYNLACYECQLGNLERAKEWLEAAFRLGHRDPMKQTALEDPDLEPLWSYLRSR